MDYYRKMLAILAVLCLSIIQLATSADLPVHTAQQCVKVGEHPTVHLTCPTGHLIHVRKTFYGATRITTDWTCPTERSPQHCTWSDEDSFQCNGRKKCSVKLDTIARLKKIPGCMGKQFRSTEGLYVSMDYNCVPESEIQEFCSGSVTSEGKTSGYIRTPAYPHRYPPGARCDFTLQGYVISLKALDMELGQSQNNGDCLRYKGKEHKNFCGGRRQNEFLVSDATAGIDLGSDDSVLLSFETDGVVEAKGVWLYYELSVPEKYQTTLPPATEKPVALSPHPKTTKSTLNVHKTVSDKVTAHDVHNNSDGTLAITTTVGLVIGSLSFIVLILLAVFLFRRHAKPASQSDSKQAMWQTKELRVEAGEFFSEDVKKSTTLQHAALTVEKENNLSTIIVPSAYPHCKIVN